MKNKENDYLLEAIKVARLIISETNKTFTKGSANHAEDILEGHKQGVITDRILKQIRELNAIEINPADPYNAFKKLAEVCAKSRFFKIGACDEYALVGLYLADKYPALIKKAWFAIIPNCKHGLIKVKTQNDTELFVDPWFKTPHNTGAIVQNDPEVFYKYHRELIQICRKAKWAQQIRGPLSRGVTTQYFINVGACIILISYIFNTNYLMAGVYLAALEFASLFYCDRSIFLLLAISITTYIKHQSILDEIDVLYQNNKYSISAFAKTQFGIKNESDPKKVTQAFVKLCDNLALEQQDIYKNANSILEDLSKIQEKTEHSSTPLLFLKNGLKIDQEGDRQTSAHNCVKPRLF